MKRKFLMACTFIFAVTTGMLQASNPTMSRVYGNQFTPQVPDTQSAATIGTLDTTFNTTGMLPVGSAGSLGTNAVATQVLSDGTVLVLSNDSSNSYLTKYSAEGAVAWTCTLTGLVKASAYIAVDAQGRFLVAGSGNGSSTYPWIARVTAAGASDSTFTFADGASWGFSGAINQLSMQSTGFIIAVGFNGTNAMVARYNLSGGIDSTFAQSGYAILNTTATPALPTSAASLYSVVVDSLDNIYVSYTDATPSANVLRLTSAGIADATWNNGSSAIVNVAYLNTAVPSSLRMIRDDAGDLVLSAQVGSAPYDIRAASIAYLLPAPTTPGTFANFSLKGSALGGTDSFNVNNLVASSPDSTIYLVGTDLTTKYMMVVACTSAGILNLAFNPSAVSPAVAGVNFFRAGIPSVSALLNSGSIAPDGQLYVAGAQDATTPYLTRLNNSPYVTQTAQFPVTTQEQGILDLSFGQSRKQTFSGVTTPFNGLYGSSMMQRATAAIEITEPLTSTPIAPLGDILIGMNGFTNANNNQSMMFSFLTSAGIVDTSVTAGGTPGYITLANQSTTINPLWTNEYLNAMLQSNGGSIVVAGYASTSSTPTLPGNAASTSATLRVYGTTTTGTASLAYSEAGSGWQGVGVSQQGITRTLFCVAESTTAGHISGTTSFASLDNTFGPYVSGSSGPQTGQILSGSYGLNMGPCYGLAVTATDDIYAAYVKTGTSQVDVAAFVINGSALLTGFGTAGSGVKPDLFTVADYTVAPNNVRIGFINTNTELSPTYDLVVAATGTGTGTGSISNHQYLLVAALDPVTGAFDGSFNSGNPLAIDTTPLTTTSSVLNLTRVTGVSDGTVLLTFFDSVSEVMYLARVTQNGALDATFNSQGVKPGILPISIGDQVATYNARVATTALVQSYPGANQGNIIVAGYESITANDVTPMVMRSYGDAGSTEIIDYPVTTVAPGTFDTAFDVTALDSLAGSGKVIFTYPSGSTHANTMLIGIDTGATSIVARVNSLDMTLDTSFNNPSGYVTLSGSLNGINHVSIDKNNNILVGGQKTVSPTGWAAAISDDGTTTTLFAMPTSPQNIAAVNNIGQQQSGRYIVAGTEATTGKGIVIAFQDKVVSPATTFAIDPTFNPIPANSAAAGSFYVASVDGLYAMAINPNDTIVAAYLNAGTMSLVEIAADGSGLAPAFNGGVIIPTTISADSSAVIQLNIDMLGNVVVGASYNSGSTHQVQAQRFDAVGGTSTAFTGSGVSGGIQTLPFTGSSPVTLTGLMETTTQQTVLTGYNVPSGSPAANGPLFAAGLSSTGARDINWNASSTAPDYPGLLTYGSETTPAAVKVTGSAIALNGFVYSIGSSATPNPHAIVTVVYGDLYIAEVAQNPLEAVAGTKDLTIPGSVTGALNLASSPSSVIGVPQRMYIYNSTVNSSANGAMLIASTAATRYAYITQLNADLSLNTNFNAGSGTPGYVTLDLGAGNVPTVTDMYVATGNLGIVGIATEQKYIYVTGYTTASGVNTPFAVQIAPTGLGSPVSVSPAPLTTTSRIRQSSNSRILIAGYNGTSGAVVAYNSTMTALDTSFGNGTGYYVTGVANPIATMVTDNLDRIYIAYASVGGTSIIIKRLLENGTIVDSTFNPTFITMVNGYSATQIKMAIDLVNNQLIVAAQDGTSAHNIMQLARFNLAGTTVGTLSAISISGVAINLADLFIDNNSTLYSGLPNIYVAGYTSSSNSIVARVESPTTTSLALDTTYGNYASGTSGPQTGIANISESPMTIVKAAALDPDRRVYMVGSNTAANTGYMGRFFGDYYWKERYSSITQGAIGSVDPTLSPNSGNVDTGVAGIDLTAAPTSWSTLAGYTAYAIIENSDGSSYIAFGNGTNLVVGKVNADMSPATFGTGGLTTVSLPMTTVNNMSIDNAGNVVVCGVNAGGAGIGYIVAAAGTNLLARTAGSPVTAANTILQQKSGRYLIAGSATISSTSYGAITAYKNLSSAAGSPATLPIDGTFGQPANAGFCKTVAANPIDDMCIDSNDYIYIVSSEAANGVVYLAKLTPQGELVSAANSPSAQVWSTNPIPTPITANAPARVAINSVGNILVGASIAGIAPSSGFNTQLYNGLLGTAIGTTLSRSFHNTPILTRLVGSGTEFYGLLSNSTSVAGASVFAVDNGGILDSTFNGGAVLPLSGQTPSLTHGMNGLSVQFDGKVVAVGYNGTDPILMRAYAYPYVAQFAQQPDQAPAGILDTTLWPTSGALELDTYSPLSTITTLSGSQVSRIYEYITNDANNGKALLLFSGTNSGADTVLARVNIDLTLDTTFNTLGTNNPSSAAGYVTISGETNANALLVDSLGNIFVAGGGTLLSPATSWVRGYTSAGVVLTGWTNPTANLANGAFQIGQQSNSRLILAGLGTSNFNLFGYTTTGALDTSFGNVTPTPNGTVNMGSTDPITDFAIDGQGNIITVKIHSSSTMLQKVSQSGSFVQTITGGTAISSPLGSVKVVLDTAGSIVVASATSAGFTIARYAAGGADNGAQLTIAASATPVLGNIYATTDGNITLIGYESTTPYKVVVARIISSPSGVSNANMLFDVTFSASSTPQGILQTVINSAAFLALDGTIGADDRIMLAGSQISEPFLARVFGDAYVSVVSQSQALGVPGTLNTSFGTGGSLVYGGLTSTTAVLNGAQGKAIFTLADSGYYQVFDNANSGANSILIKTLIDGSLDPNYNPLGSAGAGIATGYARLGVNSMLQGVVTGSDSASNVLLVGTDATGGWLQRYTSAGVVDNGFGSSGVVSITATNSGTTVAAVAVEQTLGRYVVAGYDGANAALFAYKSLAPTGASGLPGSADTTFNSTGAHPGRFILSSPSNANQISTLTADQYDRLIFAVLNGTNVDLYRLTPTGELDITFGIAGTGIVSSVLANAANATQVFVALDANNNIIVAATSSTAHTFSLAAYDNGVSTGSGANGHSVYTQSNILTALTAPAITALVTSTDGYALVLGTQTAPGAAWVARIVSSNAVTPLVPGTLDAAGFDPAGTIPGIFQYTGAGTTAHIYDGLAVNADGTLGMLGYENSSSATPPNVPTLVSIYNNPYVAQESQTPDSKPVGAIDATLGVGAMSTALTAVQDGVVFYGDTATDSTFVQVAQAVALYNDNNIVVAIDGGNATSLSSSIMINMFDNDGLLNPNFGSSGTAVVLQGSDTPGNALYQNQYVNDMVTFTSGGVTKAILAGYVHNTILGTNDSLVLQYELVPGGTSQLDPNFGGYNGNPDGIAFGDGQNAFVVGQQSTGRIIVGGLSQDNLGLLLGYTADGKLDTSFGNDGYQSVNTGSTGIYTHAIDNQNRVVFAYNNAGTVVVARMLADGSGLDSSFDASASYIAGVTSNSNIKIAVDSSNNVYVAAGVTANSITVSSYNNSTGHQITTNTIAGSSLGSALATYTMSRTIVDAAGNIIVVAYDTHAHTTLVMRLVSALTLDPTFNAVNAYSNPAGTPGYITYQVNSGNSNQVATDAMVHPDGRIIVVGSEL